MSKKPKERESARPRDPYNPFHTLNDQAAGAVPFNDVDMGEAKPLDQD